MQKVDFAESKPIEACDGLKNLIFMRDECLIASIISSGPILPARPENPAICMKVGATMRSTEEYAKVQLDFMRRLRAA